MSETPEPPLIPFDPKRSLGEDDLATLRAFLQKRCPNGLQLTVDYTVGDLVEDLGNIIGGIESGHYDLRE